MSLFGTVNMSLSIDAEFAVQRDSDKSYRIYGELTFSTAGEALRKTPQLACEKGQGECIGFDLSGITRVDSAGLAVLLEWQRMSLVVGGRLKYLNFPNQVLALAKVANVDEILSAFSE